MRDPRARPADLGGDDQSVAIPPRLEPAAEILLGAALGFRPRRHRVKFGGIDEIDAGGDGAVELAVGLDFAVLLSPVHGSQADGADLEVGPAQCSKLHDGFLFLVD